MARKTSFRTVCDSLPLLQVAEGEDCENATRVIAMVSDGLNSSLEFGQVSSIAIASL